MIKMTDQQAKHKLAILWLTDLMSRTSDVDDRIMISDVMGLLEADMKLLENIPDGECQNVAM